MNKGVVVGELSDSADKKKASEAAQKLGRRGGLKGGKARAEKLTPDQRTAIARRAVEARWAKARANGEVVRPALPRATHGSEDHPLKIFDIEIPCFVLEDGTRVITNRGLQRSLGMAESGGAQRLADLVERFRSKGIDAKDLPARIMQPLQFRPLQGGRSAYGYEATVLADLCDAILEARSAGVLTTKFDLRLAEHSELLVRGFARVGIIALVDEATGYQNFRSRRALEEILEKFISKELAKWAKTFPDEFYQELFRLRKWKYDPKSSKRPGYVAQLTVDLIYARLAPGVYEELQRVTPRDEKGRLKYKLFQRLTEDVGHPRLREHFSAVNTLMKAFDNWDHFYYRLERALPKYNETDLLPFKDEPEDEPTE